MLFKVGGIPQPAYTISRCSRFHLYAYWGVIHQNASRNFSELELGKSDSRLSRLHLYSYWGVIHHIVSRNLSKLGLGKVFKHAMRYINLQNPYFRCQRLGRVILDFPITIRPNAPRKFKMYLKEIIKVGSCHLKEVELLKKESGGGPEGPTNYVVHYNSVNY